MQCPASPRVIAAHRERSRQRCQETERRRRHTDGHALLPLQPRQWTTTEILRAWVEMSRRSPRQRACRRLRTPWEILSVVPAVRADVAAVTEVVVALESSLYPQASSSFSHEDLVDEWSGLDLERNTYVVRDGDRVVGYGAVRDRGELWRAEGYVHPAAHGRGIGKLLAATFERDAAARGARRIHNGVYELDAAACSLLQSIGYRAVRVFREMRIELAAPPPIPTWPEGLRVAAFDPERDAPAFHAAQLEAFADHWEYVAPISSPGRGSPDERAVRPGPVVRRQSRRRDRRRNDLHRRHLRRRLRPDPVHASPVAQARHRRGARRGRVPQALGARRASASGSASTRRAALERFASTSVPE